MVFSLQIEPLFMHVSWRFCLIVVFLYKVGYTSFSDSFNYVKLFAEKGNQVCIHNSAEKAQN